MWFIVLNRWILNKTGFLRATICQLSSYMWPHLMQSSRPLRMRFVQTVALGLRGQVRWSNEHSWKEGRVLPTHLCNTQKLMLSLLYKLPKCSVCGVCWNAHNSTYINKEISHKMKTDLHFELCTLRCLVSAEGSMSAS